MVAGGGVGAGGGVDAGGGGGRWLWWLVRKE